MFVAAMNFSETNAALNFIELYPDVTTTSFGHH